MRIETLHAHLPWSRIHELLPLFEELSLCAEVGLSGFDLDRMSRRTFDLPELITPPRPVTIHAPFNDLNPGAGDPRIIEVTRIRLLQTLDFAERTGARLIVCHPGYEHWRYAGNIDLWLEASLKFWPEILGRAEQLNCHIAVENVFDTHYEALLRLLNSLDHPMIGHCFDIGHWHLFSEVKLTEWFDALAPHLKHLHLHDNTGTSDAHLPIGEGNIPFQSLWTELQQRQLAPSMTLEAHHPNHLRRTVAALHAAVSQTPDLS
jgi:sugar phosphate isomerase/epimerase